MTQAKEEKRGLLAFWEGFKEGWNGSSATAKETPPPAPVDEVITAADEWDVDELPETAGAAESIDVADEWDMPEPMMTTAEPPQEKRGLTAFFEGFKDGWNNPPAYETNSNNKTVYDDEDWDIGAQTNYSLFPEVHVTYDPVYGSSDAMGMNHEPGRAVYIYEDKY